MNRRLSTVLIALSFMFSSVSSLADTNCPVETEKATVAEVSADEQSVEQPAKRKFGLFKRNKAKSKVKTPVVADTKEVLEITTPNANVEHKKQIKQNADYPTNYNVRRVFALGRSAGAAYYHLIDLCDRAEDLPFSQIQNEYSEAFQNLNIIDIIFEDI